MNGTQTYEVLLTTNYTIIITMCVSHLRRTLVQTCLRIFKITARSSQGKVVLWVTTDFFLLFMLASTARSYMGVI